MGIPLLQQAYVGGYVVRQHLKGRKRYPLVLMLEPLFRCNLACAGCGKIDYPDKILNQRLSVAQCLEAVDECGAPVVSIAGGEPLIHSELPQIVEGIVARKKFVYLCTNALLMEKKLSQYKPSPFFVWSVHMDGGREMHDRSVCQDGVYDKALAAIRKAKARGFRISINCTLFDNADPDQVVDFFDGVKEMGVDGITISPGYAYERAPDQQHFLNRTRTKQLFRDIFRKGRGARNWSFNQSSLFLDFLAGNQEYHCTPWGNPTRNVFGWQRPCYLLGEGYARTFRELMEETDWDSYGTGNYEKCADCMVHCGYEATAVSDAVRHPLKALRVALRGVETEKAMAPDIPLDKQRPAQYVFENHVEKKLAEIGQAEAAPKAMARAG
jgi:hopanoid biosynthesis associated radical SAM protein HpnH